METNIVRIYNDEPMSGTFLISQGFKRQHDEMLKLIRKYEKDFLDLDNCRVSKGLIIQEIKTKKAGRKVQEILLNEAQTLFLGSLLRNTDKVVEFKKRLAKDYVKVKKELEKVKSRQSNVEWQELRKDGVKIRLKETDTVKEFISYAIAQGGSTKGCDMYYSNITRMLNGSLFILQGKFKNLRDVLTTEQLMVVGTVEHIIDKTLKDGMKKDTYFKEIYKSVKEKVIIFAKMHGQMEVIELALNPPNKEPEVLNEY